MEKPTRHRAGFLFCADAKGNSMRVPGVFWIVLVVILVPTLLPVLERVFPESNYWWSAVLVTMLAAVAKTVEIVYRKQIDKAGIMPAASPRPIGAGEYEYTAVPANKPSAITSWLIG